MKKIFLLILSIMLITGCTANKDTHDPTLPKVILGNERIDEPEYNKLLQNKRLGIFTNQSGVNSKMELTVDRLNNKYGLQAIYVPEHGFFGAITAGEQVDDTYYNGIKVFSLYGKYRKPSADMLAPIDAMVIDIQDVGTRHYTYFSSLAYIMEECAKLDKEVIILDRPNPLGGAMQGPVLKAENSTFIGLYTIPLRHGLTIGEFAQYINKEEKINCKLSVIPMKNWNHNMLWQDTGLEWVQSSPLIPTADTALLYAVTGVCGDTNISVGVGTAKPFHFVGADYADAQKLKVALDALNIKGVLFRSASYIPRYGNNKGKSIQGVEIYLLEPHKINLPELEYQLAYTFRQLYPEQIKYPERGYRQPGYKVDIALGESSMRIGENPQTVFTRWQNECAAFHKKAEAYLLYK